ncbi:MAG TPA: ABC transporter ATP-binding protein [Puia sp.]|jgi:ABC-type multidrug transport system fused ATPase/permease subunit|nr:ABC transporter ATP-binding protein [Puia sp.]
MSLNKKIKKNIKYSILTLILPFKKQFVWVVILSLLGTATSLIEPLIYREAINDVAGVFVGQARDSARKESGLAKEPHRKTKEPHHKGKVAPRTPQQALDTLLWAVIWLFIINLVSTLLWRIGENKNVKFSCGIEQRFILSTFRHVLNLPLGFFVRRPAAAIAKRIDQSEEVSAVVNGFSQQILPELIGLVGILGIMFYENTTLTAISLGIIPLYLLIAWTSAKKLEFGLTEYYQKWEGVSTRIQDALSGIKTVKLSGAEDRELKNLEDASSEAYADYIHRSRMANKYEFWETVLTHLSTALVLGYGGYLTLENKLTPGDVVMFVTYLDRLYSPIDNLATLWISLQQNFVSISRAFKLTDRPEEPRKGKNLLLKNGEIEFKEIEFSYTPERKILDKVSFTIEPGKMTALVGPSGAGKTTIIDLLLKLYTPDSGNIFIDGQNISNLDPATIRRQIGIISADGALFNGTIRDNISYKKPDADLHEIEEAVNAAGLEHTVKRLPLHLETRVGENGIGLSVGERQRIQIARILLAKPRILILDEATANLDYATEGEIKFSIKEIRKQNTVIIIAHRFSMVRDADHIIVLDEGKVIESGKPASLIASGGWFSDFSKTTKEEYDVAEESEEDNGE